MHKVREAIRLVERDGWRLVRTRRSHRHYHHPEKPGIVTIPGHPGEDLNAKHLAQYFEASRTSGGKQMKLCYAVVFELTANNYCAYVPDLPGCISTGKTWTDMKEMIEEAITGHIEVMLEYGDPLPERAMSLEEAMAFHCQPRHRRAEEESLGR